MGKRQQEARNDALMSRRLFIRAATAAGSLAGYYIAQSGKVRSWYPFIVIGGMLGALAGEVLSEPADDSITTEDL